MLLLEPQTRSWPFAAIIGDAPLTPPDKRPGRFPLDELVPSSGSPQSKVLHLDAVRTLAWDQVASCVSRRRSPVFFQGKSLLSSLSDRTGSPKGTLPISAFVAFSLAKVGMPTASTTCSSCGSHGLNTDTTLSEDLGGEGGYVGHASRLHTASHPALPCGGLLEST